MNSDGDLYKKAFEASPIGFMVLRLEDPRDPGLTRQIIANDAACRITGMDMKAQNGKHWSEACPELFQSVLSGKITRTALSGEPEHWEFTEEAPEARRNRWSGSAIRLDAHTVLVTFEEVAGNKQSGQPPDRPKREPENSTGRRINESSSASKELDAFTYSVSHDLRAPLRRLDGFSQELLNEYSDKLDDTGKHYLNRIRVAAQKMGSLIDDLLKLSRISRKKIQIEKFDLGALAEEIHEEMKEWYPEQEVVFRTAGDLEISADKGLFRSLMQNLLSNAWKFSADQNPAHIEVGSTVLNNYKTFYVKDDGVGFDMKYADKLFRAFQRLHSEKQFEGTGIGLATVQRIINRHGGTIWAESDPGKGTTFYFYLNQNNGQED